MCKITDFSELPAMLTPRLVGDVLGISRNNAYELVRREDPGFVVHRFGKQYRIPKQGFLDWVDGERAISVDFQKKQGVA